MNGEVGGNGIESNGIKDTIEPNKDTSDASDLSKQELDGDGREAVNFAADLAE